MPDQTAPDVLHLPKISETPSQSTATTAAPAPATPGGSIEPVPGNPLSDDLIRKQSAKYTRRAMLVMGAGASAGAGLYYYLNLDPPDEDHAQPGLLRNTFVVNQKITQALTHDHVLAPTYPLSQATELRYNAAYGCKNKLEPSNYRLQLVGVANPKSFGSRYTDDVTAWDYKLSDDPADAPDEGSFKVDPSKEKHPELRLGQGPKVAPTGTQGGDFGRADLVQPTSKQAEEKGGKAPKPEGAQAPAKNMQADRSGSDAGGGGNMATPKGLGVATSARGNVKRERGQEEAGESESGLREGTPGLLLSMEDLHKLPRHELVTQFKCIEGWSQIVHWAGVRLADVIQTYPPAPNPDGTLPKYVYMETPDGDYYCGFDLMDCTHPQSLLVTEMAGKPLTQFHGAPLRLHMPIKYGYKQIKRIGLIAYTNDLPDDYWTKLGYDWYAGL